MTHIPELVRRQVAIRAASRCEYCHLHELYAFFAHEIDHIYAEKHGGDTSLDNLCLACADCNRHKGSDICSLDPQSGNVIALFHPRRDRWSEHFRLYRDGHIIPVSPQGRVCERILQFNRPDLVSDRRRLIRLGAYDDDFE